MGNYKLKHNRNLNYSQKSMYNVMGYECRKPTEKQIKYFLRLKYVCKDNNIDNTFVREPKSREDFCLAIDELLYRLKEKGIDLSKGKQNE